MELGRSTSFLNRRRITGWWSITACSFSFLSFSLLLALNFPLSRPRPFPSFPLSHCLTRSVSIALSFTVKLPTRTEIFAESPALFRHHAFGQYAIIRYRNAYFLECRQFFSISVLPRSRETSRYNAFPYLYGLEICFDEHSHSR